MMLFGLNKEGFKRKLYSDIQDDLFTRAMDLFGEDIDLSVRSPIGIFLMIIAWSLALVWQVAENVYHQSHLPSAEGISLDYIAEKADIYRFPALKSYGKVKFTGTPGKKIYKGFKVCTTDKITFETDKEYTIGADGTVTVTVICTQPGEIGNVSKAAINTIVNPEMGIKEATNEIRFSTGREIETDDELRQRYKISFIDSGKATINAIVNHLRKIPSLKSCKVLENDTMDVVNDMKPKSIKVIVLGGSDEEVANAILDSKAAGIETNGDITVAVRDNQGIFRDMRFYRATETDIYMILHLTYRAQVTDKDIVNTNLKKRIKNHVRKLEMGETVILAQIISQIMADPAIKDVKVEIGKSLGELSENNVTLRDEQVPTILGENIIIKEV